MNNLNNLPYAQWLEQSLQNIIGKPIEAICILTKVSSNDPELGDEIGCGYWNCTTADKILFSGFIQQDAMLDTLRANGFIDDDEDDGGEDNDMEDYADG